MLSFILFGIVISQIVLIFYYQIKIKNLTEKLNSVKKFESINDLSLEDQKEYLQLLEILKDRKVVCFGSNYFTINNSGFIYKNDFYKSSIEEFKTCFLRAKERSDSSIDLDMEIKKIKSKVELYDNLIEELKK